MFFRTIRGFAVLLAVALATLLPPSAGTARASADATVADILDAFRSGRPVPMGPRSTLILGGMTDNLMRRCKGRLGLSAAESVQLAGFLTMAATRAAVGGRYSDPDLGRGIGDMMSGMAVYSAGGGMVDGIACGEPATGVLRRIHASVAAAGAGDSRFVASCTPVHGEQACRCLAEIGQSVVPGYRDTTYTKQSVHGVIQANPFLGMMIPLKCGIARY